MSVLLAKLYRTFESPNPIWIREVKQSARLGRTPWILFAITLSFTMLVASIGGLAAEASDPGMVGSILYQVYFSLAAAVVAFVGPTVAANGIASEREGRTWEALLLTGLSPRTIIRGKFLAAFGTIALYIVVLAPIGMVAFLFGGTSPIELLLGYVFLFGFAAVCITFGLAVSSQMKSLRGALIVTLLLAVSIAPQLYSFFGFFGSYVAHNLWPAIPNGTPIWYPLACTRADFGLYYVAVVVFGPLFAFGLPAWFLYEFSVTQLSDVQDDRSTRLKVWYFATTLLALAICPTLVWAPTTVTHRTAATIVSLSFVLVHLLFSTYLFAGEPLFLSRRLRVRWSRHKASAMRAWIGPGLFHTQLTVLVLGLLLLGLTSASAIAAIATGATSTSGPNQRDLFSMISLSAVFVGAVFILTVGLIAQFRAKGSPWFSRIIVSGILIAIATMPFVAVAVIGITNRGSTNLDYLAIAAPSPMYIFVLWNAVDKGNIFLIVAGLVTAGFYTMIGLSLLLSVRRTCRQKEDLALRANEEFEAFLAKEANGAPP